MATRIAKIDEQYMPDTWIVYQSLSDSSYSPMFSYELSAQLFREYAAINPGFSSYTENTQERVASIATRLITETYGEHPTKSQHYTDLIDDLESSHSYSKSRAREKFSALTYEFFERVNRKPHSKVSPEMPKDEEEDVVA